MLVFAHAAPSITHRLENLQAGGRRFESCTAHHYLLSVSARLPEKFASNHRQSAAEPHRLKVASAIMKTSNVPTRRDFLELSAALMAASGVLTTDGSANRITGRPDKSFLSHQQRRRKELWNLLGDLPWRHNPEPAKLIAKEEHEGYTLERLVLDLNGVEPVPALMLIPDKRPSPAPGLLYIHWHGGMYDLGKEQLLRGVEVQPPYAPMCVQKGIVTLAIDSWCFGERKHETDGKKGEEDAFKLMLWKGQVLYGMMMFDEVRALDYLSS